MKKAVKILRIIGIILLLFFIITFIVNLILTPIEKKKYPPYGNTVMVNGKKMNAFLQGEGATTIVLVSGYQTVAPALDFKPLIDNLSKDYRVVVIEPFGYGYSDVTNEERTIENITKELHQCLQTLGISRYVLMPHSIGGIYCLYYINRYPEEVTSMIGIDTSVPAQGDYTKLPSRSSAESLITTSGMIRIALALFPELTIPISTDSAYTDKVKDQILAMTSWNYANKTVINEGKYMRRNFDAVRALKFPDELPVLFFLSGDTIKSVGDSWLKEHKKQLADVKNSKLIHLNGTHYLHWTCSEQMGTDIRDFLKNCK